MSIFPDGSFAAFHLVCFMGPFRVRLTPLWSELLSGGITQQFTNCDGTGNSTRSIKVRLPEWLKWVCCGTTCISTKICKILDRAVADCGELESSVLLISHYMLPCWYRRQTLKQVQLNHHQWGLPILEDHFTSGLHVHVYIYIYSYIYIYTSQ